MDEKRGIGKAGRLPWHLRDDLQRFKRLTMGHHLVMGRKTYESIGHMLPGRVMIVITKNKELQISDGYIANSIEDALMIAEKNNENEVFIIGGGMIFRETLPIANRIYLTQVHTDSKADVFFPELTLSCWKEIEAQDYPADYYNQYPFTFKVLEKRLC
jgi:dihydrofolate reductase